MNEIYVSTDIETDGPAPGINSMLSFASAAFNIEGELVDTFTANIHTLPDGKQNPETMLFWARFPVAFVACRKNLQDPQEALINYTNWLNRLGGKPVFVAYPAGFDFTFMYWYLMKYTGKSPFGFSCIDMKSYASAVLKKPFRKTTWKNMPKRWFSEREHTHVALDDAIEQGELFINMYKENMSR